jgi:hypothetical protein
MIKNNKLDKSFGPVGTFAGMIVFIAGLIATFSSLYALILVFIGAFIGFTSTSTLIDYDKKRVKFSNNLLGVIHTGNWMDIDPDMKLGIKKSDLTWTAYSRTNRTLDINNQDYRIILYDAGNRKIMPIKKFTNPDSAKEELDKLANQLGIKLL